MNTDANGTHEGLSLIESKIPYVNDFHQRPKLLDRYFYASEYQSRENLFLDIGLNLDCIGGSRANSLFLAPLGSRNVKNNKSDMLEQVNYVIPSVHKKLVCGYGSNPYNFSNALKKLSKLSGRDYKAQGVTFSEEMSEFLRDEIHPSYIFNSEVARVTVEELHYTLGIENYLIRLLDFKKNVRAKINMFGSKVENGRKTKLIFIFLSAKQWQEVANNKPMLNTLEYIYKTGHEEKIMLIPCAENIADIPLTLLTDADMILGYGSHNVSVIKKIMEHKGLRFKPAKAKHKMQTVGVVYDYYQTPYVYPLKGWTKEFFLAEEKIKKWEKEEKENYLKYIRKLDDGSKFDAYNRKAKEDFIQNRKEMFAHADFMQKENVVIPKLKPVIIFE